MPVDTPKATATASSVGVTVMGVSGSTAAMRVVAPAETLSPLRTYTSLTEPPRSASGYLAATA